MNRENLILAIHSALGGNGWAYSNWGYNELTDCRSRLDAVADLFDSLQCNPPVGERAIANHHKDRRSMTVIKQITKTCDACPAQWEGITDDNRRVYVRYRWGRLSVRIGPPDDMDKFAGVQGTEIFGQAIGDSLDGIMSYDELKAHTALFEIVWPEQET